MSQGPPPPFSCSYSPNLPELLMQLNCTLVISTYQAGKVIFISAKDEQSLIQLPRTFERAMGIAIEDQKMAIATKDEINILVNSPALAATYPKKPGVYDAMFMPRVTYYTGQVDIHDLHFGQEGLWAVNTSFSCLALIGDQYSWIPKWQPHFISSLGSEDRCHLNGMVMHQGMPKYVTALGAGDQFQSWRNTLPNGGILMDVNSNEIIAHSLPMPHSPRIYDEQLFMLLSATGAIIRMDPATGTYEVVRKINGFLRGMSRLGDYIFIAQSRLRQNSSTFKDLEIADKANFAGITVIHLPTAAVVGEIRFLSSVDEIYDLQSLSGIRRPGILNTQSNLHKYGLTIPSGTFWAKDAMLKK